SGFCVRQVEKDRGLQLPICSLILAFSLSLGLPFTPSLLLGPGGTSDLVSPGCALAQGSISMVGEPSSDPGLQQGAPEPLDKGENEGIAGGVKQNARPRSPE